MSRKVMKKDKAPKKEKKAQAFASVPILNPSAAGIDIGDSLHAVAVPQGRDQNNVREFGAMSCDLDEIVQWLKKCQIETVAMESTGVYWKPLFNLLIHHGFEVYLVKPDHVKNITGRKTDMGDAAWIQWLHSCGLLKSCYLPDEQQEKLRTLVRFRRTLSRESSSYVLRMEKALELMNVKIHTVISDINGKTGTAIIQAIVGGERNAKKFLPLIDGRIKADHETIEKSLQGHWRDDQLFMLEENYRLYQVILEEISRIDQKIKEVLQEYAAIENEGELPTGTDKQPEGQEEKKAKQKSKNAPSFDVRAFLLFVLGIDVLEIYGISEIGALEILAEAGTDMTKWPTSKHFVAWLNLCPNNKVSGGKLLSSRIRKGSGAAGQAFRMAANAVQRSDHWLGIYFRRMKSKGGNRYAIVATANKIATIYYHMVKDKVPFMPVDMTDYQKKRNTNQIAYLERKLEALRKKAA